MAKGYLQGSYPTVVLITEDKRVAYIGRGEASKQKLVPRFGG